MLLEPIEKSKKAKRIWSELKNQLPKKLIYFSKNLRKAKGQRKWRQMRGKITTRAVKQHRFTSV
jgi:hypothetical protein